ncbi:A24 family peptidase [Telmatospirillum sp.]|uniref:A24 family peptidase n=1 Tax=Telmatospirillum sp. TaxID=2079197 RepID=UPI0028473241|nr:A24 family peptidase [Telmatospirillum sp.]MDR3440108.1 A24 family peptidase [Telmatospirillum sp.]
MILSPAGDVLRALVVFTPVCLVGVLAAEAARWLDQRLDRILDLGVLAVIGDAGMTRMQAGHRFSFDAAIVAVVLVAALCSGASPMRMTSAALFAGGLSVCAWIDWRHHILPDLVVFPLLALGLCLDAACHPFVDAMSGLSGGIIGAGTVGFIRFLGRWHKGCMGTGDLKFLTMIGVWTGPILVVVILSVASLITTAVLLVLSNRDRSLPCCFGPALAVATLGCLLCEGSVVAGIRYFLI